MIKAAFFDIDGTLLSFKTHRIPASAQQALDSFREQGIACIIATGRPTYQMPDWLFDLGWDAYITLSGQHCFDAKGVYRSCPIDPDDVAVIVDQVAQGRYDSLCMQGENSFVNRLSKRVVAAATMPESRITRSLLSMLSTRRFTSSAPLWTRSTRHSYRCPVAFYNHALVRPVLRHYSGQRRQGPGRGGDAGAPGHRRE